MAEAAGVAVIMISESQSDDWKHDFEAGVHWLEDDYDVDDVYPSCTEFPLTFPFCDS